jgi:hypothetical protein
MESTPTEEKPIQDPEAQPAPEGGEEDSKKVPMTQEQLKKQMEAQRQMQEMMRYFQMNNPGEYTKLQQMMEIQKEHKFWDHQPVPNRLNGQKIEEIVSFVV